MCPEGPLLCRARIVLNFSAYYKLPSKDEVKQAYGITDDDFEILTELPKVNNRGLLMRVAECFGVPTWIWRSVTGCVFAVILLFPAIKSAYDYWEPKAIYAYDAIKTAFDRSLYSDPDSIAVLPSHTDFRPNKEQPIFPQLPEGTGIYRAYQV